MMRVFIFCLIFALGLPSLAQKNTWKGVKVLVYTKNGKGYVHDNIPNAVACVQKLGKEYGFHVDVSDTPAVFTDNNLRQYAFLVFTSTNNDVFGNDEQRLVFRRYMESGGGLVGIHSVLGTERQWKWFKMMLGGTFAWHAPFQKYRVSVIDTKHESVKGLPLVWEREDECYFNKELFPGPQVIMAHQIASLNEKNKEKILIHSAPYSDLYPAVWYHPFDGGHAWITALGHHKNDYQDPVFVRHIFQGMEFVLQQVRKNGKKTPYALNAHDPVQY